jgi:hypothetical protein
MGVDVRRFPAQFGPGVSRRAWLRGLCMAAASSWIGRNAFGARHARQVVVNRQQELNLKGVYLYSFCKFVSWPDAAFAGPQAPIVIAVLGSKDLTATLQNVAKKRMANGRPLEIKQLAKSDDPVTYHLLVVTADVKADEQSQLIKRLQGTAVLIVTESAGMGEKGAHVNFYLESATVKFEINVPAAQACQLRIDPQLTALKVARLLGA